MYIPEVFIDAQAFFCIIVLYASVGLQPRNRKGLLCAPDGKGHGEGIRERGKCFLSQDNFLSLYLLE